MLQYIMHKVLSTDYISKQFKNKISSLKHHGCSVSWIGRIGDLNSAVLNILKFTMAPVLIILAGLTGLGASWSEYITQYNASDSE